MTLRLRLLGSGSSGNATLLEHAGTRLLLDAGLGPRELAERLLAAGVDPASLSAVVLSHEHQDHARGAAAFSRRWGVRLCGSRGTRDRGGLAEATTAGFDLLEPRRPLTLGTLTVLGIPVPHDAAQPLAFVVTAAGVTLGHATDVGHLTRGLAEHLRACDALLLESNYDPVLLREGPYPWALKERIRGPRGHLANDDVGRFLAAGLGEACRTVLLAHLSRKNNHPELARMVAETALRDAGRLAVRVEVAPPEGTGWLEVGPPAAAVHRGPRQGRLWE